MTELCTECGDILGWNEDVCDTCHAHALDWEARQRTAMEDARAERYVTQYRDQLLLAFGPDFIKELEKP